LFAGIAGYKTRKSSAGQRTKEKLIRRDRR